MCAMVLDSNGVSALPMSVRNSSSSKHVSSRKRKLDEKDILTLKTIGLPSTRSSDSMGPFWYESSYTAMINGQSVHRGITKKESLQLETLLATGKITAEFLDETLVPINDETSDVPRLRALNWCVTNYAKGNPVFTMKPDGKGGSILIDPAVAYAQLLKSMHRSLFDPYRRGTLLFFTRASSGTTEYTTVGQLTFILWCIDSGVDEYVVKNEEAIRKHMNQALKGKRAQGEKNKLSLIHI
jgi:hypothetical protein